MNVVRLDVGSLDRRSSKRKLFGTDGTPVKCNGVASPSERARKTPKRPKEALFVEFDNEETSLKPLIELLNLNLTSTLHRSVTIRNDEIVRQQESIVGAFVHFCPSAQTDSVWRACIAAHFYSGRFGPEIYMRACPKSAKKPKKESAEDDFAELFGRFGCFASHFQLDSCIIVPVANDSKSHLLFKGAALIQALNLVNEPLYYREGALALEEYADNEVHRQEARLKVEKVDGELGLYELQGIRWRRIQFDE